MEPNQREGPPKGNHSSPRTVGAADSDPSRLPRKERELIRHREELLDATQDLLATKPLPDLTIQDIARVSEFSVGYIYKLFESKEEIFATLVRKWLQELRAIVERHIASPGNWEARLKGLLEDMFSWLDRKPASSAGVTANLEHFARTHPSVSGEFAAFMDFYIEGVHSVFSDAVRLGELTREDPETIARTFLALVSGFTEESLRPRDRAHALEEDIPLIVDVIRRAFASEGGDD